MGIIHISTVIIISIKATGGTDALTFSVILKQLREQYGYTQQQLADTLHVSKATISHYEIGKNMPNIDTLIQLADLFDVSLDYLTGRTSARFSHNILQKPYVKGISTGVVIEQLNSLDLKHRQIFFEILKCIETDSYFNRAKK